MHLLRCQCCAKPRSVASTSLRTTYGFPKTLVNEDLNPDKWLWLMSQEGFLAAFWADVGFVKLMSNFHTPESGQVLRRVTGKEDKEERGAPTVGVEYNHFMGVQGLCPGALHHPPPREKMVVLFILVLVP